MSDRKWLEDVMRIDTDYRERREVGDLDDRIGARVLHDQWKLMTFDRLLNVALQHVDMPAKETV